LPIIYYLRLQILSANRVLLVEMAGVGGVSHWGGRRYLGEWEVVAAFGGAAVQTPDKATNGA
jgi:hypothetical protein